MNQYQIAVVVGSLRKNHLTVNWQMQSSFSLLVLSETHEFLSVIVRLGYSRFEQIEFCS